MRSVLLEISFATGNPHAYLKSARYGSIHTPYATIGTLPVNLLNVLTDLALRHEHTS